MIGSSIWHLVEESTKNKNTCRLERTSRHGRDTYRILINGDFDNYYYNSNDAFNALERWEVRNDILPSTYCPEEI